jgi:hypothetical protein
MTRRLDLTGSRVDLDVRQGATLKPFGLKFKNPDKSPVNLAGATVRGEIRKSAGDADPPKVTLDVVYVDRALGWVTLGAAAMQMNLPCGETINHPDSQYRLDIWLIDALGEILAVIYGVVRVRAWGDAL